MKPSREIHEDVLKWLLEKEEPASRYRTLIDLLDRPEKDFEVRKALSEIPKVGWGKKILRTQKREGYWERRRSLYRPKYTSTNWRCLVLSDLGLTRDVPGIRKAADLFFRDWMTQSKENIFRDEVCIVGNTARMMTRFGYYDDSRVRRLFDRLLEDQKEDGGWHCFNSDSGTLDCWEALAAYLSLPKSRRTRRINRSIERGAEFYLKRRLMNEGRKYLPWLRFHYPNHYFYDILVGLDVITALGFPSDRRLLPALEILKSKRGPDGKWPLDGIHPDIGSGAGYKLNPSIRRFGLERVKESSKWITLCAMRILKRVEG